MGAADNAPLVFEGGVRSLAENDREPSQLGMQLGEQYWLLELRDVVEVMPLPKLVPLPFTRPWFAGVAYLHGNAVGVVDFGAFLGAPALERQEGARLVLLAERARCHAALLFDRALGLQPCDRLVRSADTQPTSSPWIRAFFRDPEGLCWNLLDVEALLSHPDFLRIELPE